MQKFLIKSLFMMITLLGVTSLGHLTEGVILANQKLNAATVKGNVGSYDSPSDALSIDSSGEQQCSNLDATYTVGAKVSTLSGLEVTYGFSSLQKTNPDYKTNNNVITVSDPNLYPISNIYFDGLRVTDSDTVKCDTQTLGESLYGTQKISRKYTIVASSGINVNYTIDIYADRAGTVYFNYTVENTVAENKLIGSALKFQLDLHKDQNDLSTTPLPVYSLGGNRGVYIKKEIDGKQTQSAIIFSGLPGLVGEGSNGYVELQTSNPFIKPDNRRTADNYNVVGKYYTDCAEIGGSPDHTLNMPWQCTDAMGGNNEWPGMELNSYSYGQEISPKFSPDYPTPAADLAATKHFGLEMRWDSRSIKPGASRTMSYAVNPNYYSEPPTLINVPETIYIGSDQANFQVPGKFKDKDSKMMSSLVISNANDAKNVDYIAENFANNPIDSENELPKKDVKVPQELGTTEGSSLKMRVLLTDDTGGFASQDVLLVRSTQAEQSTGRVQTNGYTEIDLTNNQTLPTDKELLTALAAKLFIKTGETESEITDAITNGNLSFLDGYNQIVANGSKTGAFIVEVTGVDPNNQDTPVTSAKAIVVVKGPGDEIAVDGNHTYLLAAKDFSVPKTNLPLSAQSIGDVNHANARGWKLDISGIMSITPILTNTTGNHLMEKPYATSDNIFKVSADSESSVTATGTVEDSKISMTAKPIIQIEKSNILPSTTFLDSAHANPIIKLNDQVDTAATFTSSDYQNKITASTPVGAYIVTIDGTASTDETTSTKVVVALTDSNTSVDEEKKLMIYGENFSKNYPDELPLADDGLEAAKAKAWSLDVNFANQENLAITPEINDNILSDLTAEYSQVVPKTVDVEIKATEGQNTIQKTVKASIVNQSPFVVKTNEYYVYTVGEELTEAKIIGDLNAKLSQNNVTIDGTNVSDFYLEGEASIDTANPSAAVITIHSNYGGVAATPAKALIVIRDSSTTLYPVDPGLDEVPNQKPTAMIRGINFKISKAEIGKADTQDKVYGLSQAKAWDLTQTDVGVIESKLPTMSPNAIVDGTANTGPVNIEYSLDAAGVKNKKIVTGTVIDAVINFNFKKKIFMKVDELLSQTEFLSATGINPSLTVDGNPAQNPVFTTVYTPDEPTYQKVGVNEVLIQADADNTDQISEHVILVIYDSNVTFPNNNLPDGTPDPNNKIMLYSKNFGEKNVSELPRADRGKEWTEAKAWNIDYTNPGLNNNLIEIEDNDLDDDNPVALPGEKSVKLSVNALEQNIQQTRTGTIVENRALAMTLSNKSYNVSEVPTQAQMIADLKPVLKRGELVLDNNDFSFSTPQYDEIKAATETSVFVVKVTASQNGNELVSRNAIVYVKAQNDIVSESSDGLALVAAKNFDVVRSTLPFENAIDIALPNYANARGWVLDTNNIPGLLKPFTPILQNSDASTNDLLDGQNIPAANTSVEQIYQVAIGDQAENLAEVKPKGKVVDLNLELTATTPNIYKIGSTGIDKIPTETEFLDNTHANPQLKIDGAAVTPDPGSLTSNFNQQVKKDTVGAYKVTISATYQSQPISTDVIVAITDENTVVDPNKKMMIYAVDFDVAITDLPYVDARQITSSKARAWALTVEDFNKPIAVNLKESNDLSINPPTIKDPTKVAVNLKATNKDVSVEKAVEANVKESRKVQLYSDEVHVYDITEANFTAPDKVQILKDLHVKLKIGTTDITDGTIDLVTKGDLDFTKTNVATVKITGKKDDSNVADPRYALIVVKGADAIIDDKTKVMISAIDSQFNENEIPTSATKIIEKSKAQAWSLTVGTTEGPNTAAVSVSLENDTVQTNKLFSFDTVASEEKIPQNFSATANGSVAKITTNAVVIKGIPLILETDKVHTFIANTIENHPTGSATEFVKQYYDPKLTFGGEDYSDVGTYIVPDFMAKPEDANYIDFTKPGVYRTKLYASAAIPNVAMERTEAIIYIVVVDQPSAYPNVVWPDIEGDQSNYDNILVAKNFMVQEDEVKAKLITASEIAKRSEVKAWNLDTAKPYPGAGENELVPNLNPNLLNQNSCPEISDTTNCNALIVGLAVEGDQVPNRFRVGDDKNPEVKPKGLVLAPEFTLSAQKLVIIDKDKIAIPDEISFYGNKFADVIFKHNDEAVAANQHKITSNYSSKITSNSPVGAYEIQVRGTFTDPNSEFNGRFVENKIMVAIVDSHTSIDDQNKIMIRAKGYAEEKRNLPYTEKPSEKVIEKAEVKAWELVYGTERPVQILDIANITSDTAPDQKTINMTAKASFGSGTAEVIGQKPFTVTVTNTTPVLTADKIVVYNEKDLNGVVPSKDKIIEDANAKLTQNDEDVTSKSSISIGDTYSNISAIAPSVSVQELSGLAPDGQPTSPVKVLVIVKSANGNVNNDDKIYIDASNFNVSIDDVPTITDVQIKSNTYANVHAWDISDEAIAGATNGTLTEIPSAQISLSENSLTQHTAQEGDKNISNEFVATLAEKSAATTSMADVTASKKLKISANKFIIYPVVKDGEAKVNEQKLLTDVQVKLTKLNDQDVEENMLDGEYGSINNVSTTLDAVDENDRPIIDQSKVGPHLVTLTGAADSEIATTKVLVIFKDETTSIPDETDPKVMIDVNDFEANITDLPYKDDANGTGSEKVVTNSQAKAWSLSLEEISVLDVTIDPSTKLLKSDSSFEVGEDVPFKASAKTSDNIEVSKTANAKVLDDRDLALDVEQILIYRLDKNQAPPNGNEAFKKAAIKSFAPANATTSTDYDTVVTDKSKVGVYLVNTKAEVTNKKQEISKQTVVVIANQNSVIDETAKLMIDAQSYTEKMASLPYPSATGAASIVSGSNAKAWDLTNANSLNVNVPTDTKLLDQTAEFTDPSETVDLTLNAEKDNKKVEKDITVSLEDNRPLNLTVDQIIFYPLNQLPTSVDEFKENVNATLTPTLSPAGTISVPNFNALENKVGAYILTVKGEAAGHDPVEKKVAVGVYDTNTGTSTENKLMIQANDYTLQMTDLPANGAFQINDKHANAKAWDLDVNSPTAGKLITPTINDNNFMTWTSATGAAGIYPKQEISASVDGTEGGKRTISKEVTATLTDDRTLVYNVDDFKQYQIGNQPSETDVITDLNTSLKIDDIAVSAADVKYSITNFSDINFNNPSATVVEVVATSTKTPANFTQQKQKALILITRSKDGGEISTDHRVMIDAQNFEIEKTVLPTTADDVVIRSKAIAWDLTGFQELEPGVIPPSTTLFPTLENKTAENNQLLAATPPANGTDVKQNLIATIGQSNAKMTVDGTVIESVFAISAPTTLVLDVADSNFPTTDEAFQALIDPLATLNGKPVANANITSNFTNKVTKKVGAYVVTLSGTLDSFSTQKRVIVAVKDSNSVVENNSILLVANDYPEQRSNLPYLEANAAGLVTSKAGVHAWDIANVPETGDVASEITPVYPNLSALTTDNNVQPKTITVNATSGEQTATKNITVSVIDNIPVLNSDPVVSYKISELTEKPSKTKILADLKAKLLDVNGTELTENTEITIDEASYQQIVITNPSANVIQIEGSYNDVNATPIKAIVLFTGENPGIDLENKLFIDANDYNISIDNIPATAEEIIGSNYANVHAWDLSITSTNGPITELPTTNISLANNAIIDGTATEASEPVQNEFTVTKDQKAASTTTLGTVTETEKLVISATPIIKQHVIAQGDTPYTEQEFYAKAGVTLVKKGEDVLAENYTNISSNSFATIDQTQVGPHVIDVTGTIENEDGSTETATTNVLVLMYGDNTVFPPVGPDENKLMLDMQDYLVNKTALPYVDKTDPILVSAAEQIASDASAKAWDLSQVKPDSNIPEPKEIAVEIANDTKLITGQQTDFIDQEKVPFKGTATANGISVNATRNATVSDNVANLEIDSLIIYNVDKSEKVPNADAAFLEDVNAVLSPAGPENTLVTNLTTVYPDAISRETIGVKRVTVTGTVPNQLPTSKNVVVAVVDNNTIVDEKNKLMIHAVDYEENYTKLPYLTVEGNLTAAKSKIKTSSSAQAWDLNNASTLEVKIPDSTNVITGANGFDITTPETVKLSAARVLAPTTKVEKTINVTINDDRILELTADELITYAKGTIPTTDQEFLTNVNAVATPAEATVESDVLKKVINEVGAYEVTVTAKLAGKADVTKKVIVAVTDEDVIVDKNQKLMLSAHDFTIDTASMPELDRGEKLSEARAWDLSLESFGPIRVIMDDNFIDDEIVQVPTPNPTSITIGALAAGHRTIVKDVLATVTDSRTLALTSDGYAEFEVGAAPTEQKIIEELAAEVKLNDSVVEDAQVEITNFETSTANIDFTKPSATVVELTVNHLGLSANTRAIVVVKGAKTNVSQNHKVMVDASAFEISQDSLPTTAQKIIQTDGLYAKAKAWDLTITTTLGPITATLNPILTETNNPLLTTPKPEPDAYPQEITATLDNDTAKTTVDATVVAGKILEIRAEKLVVVEKDKLPQTDEDFLKLANPILSYDGKPTANGQFSSTYKLDTITGVGAYLINVTGQKDGKTASTNVVLAVTDSDTIVDPEANLMIYAKDYSEDRSNLPYVETNAATTVTSKANVRAWDLETATAITNIGYPDLTPVTTGTFSGENIKKVVKATASKGINTVEKNITVSVNDNVPVLSGQRVVTYKVADLSKNPLTTSQIMSDAKMELKVGNTLIENPITNNNIEISQTQFDLIDQSQSSATVVEVTGKVGEIPSNTHKVVVLITNNTPGIDQDQTLAIDANDYNISIDYVPTVTKTELIEDYAQVRAWNIADTSTIGVIKPLPTSDIVLTDNSISEHTAAEGDEVNNDFSVSKDSKTATVTRVGTVSATEKLVINADHFIKYPVQAVGADKVTAEQFYANINLALTKKGQSVLASDYSNITSSFDSIDQTVVKPTVVPITGSYSDVESKETETAATYALVVFYDSTTTIPDGDNSMIDIKDYDVLQTKLPYVVAEDGTTASEQIAIDATATAWDLTDRENPIAIPVEIDPETKLITGKQTEFASAEKVPFTGTATLASNESISKTANATVIDDRDVILNVDQLEIYNVNEVPDSKQFLDDVHAELSPDGKITTDFDQVFTEVDGVDPKTQVGVHVVKVSGEVANKPKITKKVIVAVRDNDTNVDETNKLMIYGQDYHEEMVNVPYMENGPTIIKGKATARAWDLTTGNSLSVNVGNNKLLDPNAIFALNESIDVTLSAKRLLSNKEVSTNIAVTIDDSRPLSLTAKDLVIYHTGQLPADDAAFLTDAEANIFPGGTITVDKLSNIVDAVGVYKVKLTGTQGAKEPVEQDVIVAVYDELTSIFENQKLMIRAHDFTDKIKNLPMSDRGLDATDAEAWDLSPSSFGLLTPTVLDNQLDDENAQQTVKPNTKYAVNVAAYTKDRRVAQKEVKATFTEDRKLTLTSDRYIEYKVNDKIDPAEMLNTLNAEAKFGDQVIDDSYINTEDLGFVKTDKPGAAVIQIEAKYNNLQSEGINILIVIKGPNTIVDNEHKVLIDASDFSVTKAELVAGFTESQAVKKANASAWDLSNTLTVGPITNSLQVKVTTKDNELFNPNNTLIDGDKVNTDFYAEVESNDKPIRATSKRVGTVVDKRAIRLTGAQFMRYDVGSKVTEADFIKAINAKLNVDKVDVTDGEISAPTFTNIDFSQVDAYVVQVTGTYQGLIAKPLPVIVAVTDINTAIDPIDPGFPGGPTDPEGPGLPPSVPRAMVRAEDFEYDVRELLGTQDVVIDKANAQAWDFTTAFETGTINKIKPEVVETGNDLFDPNNTLEAKDTVPTTFNANIEVAGEKEVAISTKALATMIDTRDAVLTSKDLIIYDKGKVPTSEAVFMTEINAKLTPAGTIKSDFKQKVNDEIGAYTVTLTGKTYAGKTATKKVVVAVKDGDVFIPEGNRLMIYGVDFTQDAKELPIDDNGLVKSKAKAWDLSITAENRELTPIIIKNQLSANPPTLFAKDTVDVRITASTGTVTKEKIVKATITDSRKGELITATNAVYHKNELENAKKSFLTDISAHVMLDGKTLDSNADIISNFDQVVQPLIGTYKVKVSATTSGGQPTNDTEVVVLVKGDDTVITPETTYAIDAHDFVVDRRLLPGAAEAGIKVADARAWNLQTGDEIPVFVEQSDIDTEGDFNSTLGAHPVVFGADDNKAIPITTNVNANVISTTPPKISSKDIIVFDKEKNEVPADQASFFKAIDAKIVVDNKPVSGKLESNYVEQIKNEVGAYFITITGETDEAVKAPDKHVIVFVKDKNTIETTNELLYAHSFKVDLKDVETLTDPKVIKLANAVAWDKKTGLTLEVTPDYSKVESKAGPYPVNFKTAKGASRDVTASVIDEQTEINPKEAIHAIDFEVDIKDVPKLDQNVEKLADAYAWELETGKDLALTHDISKVEAKLGTYPVSFKTANGLEKVVMATVKNKNVDIEGDTAIHGINFTISIDQVQAGLTQSDVLTKTEAFAWSTADGHELKVTTDPTTIKPVIGPYPVILIAETGVSKTVIASVVNDEVIQTDQEAIYGQDFIIQSSEVKDQTDQTIVDRAHAIAWNKETGELLEMVVSRQGLKAKPGPYPIKFATKAAKPVATTVTASVVDGDTEIKPDESEFMYAHNFVVHKSEVQSLIENLVVQKAEAKAWLKADGSKVKFTTDFTAIKPELGNYPVIFMTEARTIRVVNAKVVGDDEVIPPYKPVEPNKPDKPEIGVTGTIGFGLVACILIVALILLLQFRAKIHKGN
ncbi:MAG: hypothetical protein ACRCUP_05260 [Mycoplasmatales bacterium]